MGKNRFLVHKRDATPLAPASAGGLRHVVYEYFSRSKYIPKGLLRTQVMVTFSLRRSAT